jgi:hypothetical protein
MGRAFWLRFFLNSSLEEEFDLFIQGPMFLFGERRQVRF